MKLLVFLAIVAGVWAAVADAANAADPKRRPMQVDDLFKFKRVADPQVSPDGTHVVYQVTTVDADANSSSTALYLVATDGKSPPRVLTNPNGKKDTHPRWSPDGKFILFESTRAGTLQLYKLNVGGGEAVPLTTLKTGAGTAVWSPDGKAIAFVSAVFPEFSGLPFAEADAKNAARDDERAKNPVKAKVFTKLFYRHWDSYVEDKRQHLFVCDADGKGVRDVTPGDRDAYPTSTTFSVGDDFTFTPDSKHLVFAAPPAQGESWSTNYDLCRVAVTNTSEKWETLTGANKAADNGPKCGSDWYYWRSQKKAGYEADKWDLVRAKVSHPDGKLGPVENLTAKHDLSVNEFASFGGTAVFTADKDGRTTLFSLTGGQVRVVPTDGSVSGLTRGVYSPVPEQDYRGGPRSEDVLAFTQASMSRPAEVIVRRGRQVESLLHGDGTGGGPGDGSNAAARNVSNANNALLAQLDVPKPESVTVPVEGGDMQMWLLKPPGFDASKKWPLVYLVHGGPQGAWEDGWSYRWNPQLWAAQGYVVAMPNPRGSTGFGQKFVDEISGDWGGKCYRDLEAGLAHLEKLPYVDKDRVASAGGSFGGYMQNWFAVSPIAAKFKCLVTHCSVWNFESMWGTTDELWFDEYEHGGLPWEVPGKYAEFSPHKRAKELSKYKVPMLVIHNDLDFRCPIGQGHELFTALQRQGVPSRFVNFPDEGHWVLKPQNSRVWHKEVFGWLAKYVPAGGR